MTMKDENQQVKGGFVLFRGSSVYGWGKRGKHGIGHMWCVSRMEASKKIKKNKNKIESVVRINRCQEKSLWRGEIVFFLVCFNR